MMEVTKESARQKYSSIMKEKKGITKIVNVVKNSKLVGKDKII